MNILRSHKPGFFVLIFLLLIVSCASLVPDSGQLNSKRKLTNADNVRIPYDAIFAKSREVIKQSDAKS